MNHIEYSTREDSIDSIVSFILSSSTREYLMSDYLSERFIESDRMEIIRRVMAK